MVMRLAVVLFVIAISYGASAPSAAHDEFTTISVSGEEVIGLAEKDGKGLYWDVIRKIFAHHDIEVKTVSLPNARAYHGLIVSNTIDAILGMRPHESEALYFPKWHYDVNFISVMYRADRFATWSGEYGLKSKAIGEVRTSNYSSYLYSPVDLQQVNNRESGIMMLIHDRIDAFLDNRLGLERALAGNFKIRRTLELENIEYKIENLIPIRQYLAFATTKKGRELAQLYDEGFSAILQSGELKALFEKYQHPTFPFDEALQYQ